MNIVLNIVTALSRPSNILSMLQSMGRVVDVPEIRIRWIVVYDAESKTSPPPLELQEVMGSKIAAIIPVSWTHGACRFGINQKNYGIDHAEPGYYHLLDDDNIIHPAFFKKLSEVIKANPEKQAFGFNQLRWDMHGDLPCRADRMKPGKIDNTMFVVHTDFIGSKRYDITKAGTEDGFFFQELYKQDPSAWVFTDEYVTYYNYLSQKVPERKVVVTLGDEKFRPITDQTFPLIQKYAQRHGAEFIALTDREYPDANICYEKLRLERALALYDRVLYVDGDVLIHPDAPDIFAAVPREKFAAMDEATYIEGWTEKAIRDQVEPYGWEDPWNGIYFNAGVMLLSKAHRGIFRGVLVTDKVNLDQPYFNVAVRRERIPFFTLPKEWNFLAYHPYTVVDDIRSRAWFTHFSGNQPFETKVQDIAAAIACWPIKGTD
jgi:hypothetical protein